MDSRVRIESIEIKNFKNVKQGQLSFENTKKSYDSSILGLYGQNGSGKTALIDALLLLKYALSGQSVPPLFADYINIDADFATLTYDFLVNNYDKDAKYRVTYSLNIRKDIIQYDVNEVDDKGNKYKSVIFGETLSYSYKGPDNDTKKLLVVDTGTESVFIPKTKYATLVGDDESIKTDLLAEKKYAAKTSTSFIFSKALIEAIKNKCKVEHHVFLFNRLSEFGKQELFVVNTLNSGLITLNALPLTFRHETVSGRITLQLNKPSVIPQKFSTVIKSILKSMNIVLSQLIPGLTIDTEDLGTQVLEDGSIGNRIQLVSYRNNKKLPLMYESEGIKKIISVLQLLIVVYNDPSITVAIDELDSGIFEYLLGELLRIISEKGKGQLVFTSHNLRPLETLNRGFIAFTTTNPENRYIRLSNVKTNNNLRDFYYRDIVLGEQDEPVYEATNNYEIALAFMEAGKTDGT